MPQIVWTAGADGGADYFNRRWFEYTGMTPERGRAERLARWSCIPTTCRRRSRGATQTLATGEPFEIEYRLPQRRRRVPLAPRPRRADPRRDGGSIEFWVGTATDIDDRKRIEEQRASSSPRATRSRSSLDYRETLRRRSRELAAGEIADWCAVDVVEADGSIAQVAVAHRDPAKVDLRARAAGALSGRPRRADRRAAP